jgi:hypothetical protein
MCAECQTKNVDGLEARFCPKCGTARVTALNAPDQERRSILPWERPGWKESKATDPCDEPGCTKTVREHIDECLAITAKPGTLFTRSSHRGETPP